MVPTADENTVGERRRGQNTSACGESPQRCPRIMDLIERQCCIERTGILGDGCGRKLHSQASRLIHHPAERNVRQGRAGGIAAWCIPSTDIAMNPAKPYLLKRLPRHRSGCPERRWKLLSPFVDGQRVKCIFDVGIKRGVEESIDQRIDSAKERWYAERTYRIPDADHGYGRCGHGVLSRKSGKNSASLSLVPISLKGILHKLIVKILARKATG